MGLAVLALSLGKRNSTAYFGCSPRWESSCSAVGHSLDRGRMKGWIGGLAIFLIPWDRVATFFQRGGQRLEGHPKLPCESDPKAGH